MHRIKTWMTKYSLSIFSNFAPHVERDKIFVILSSSASSCDLKLEVWNPGGESVWSLYWQSMVDHLRPRPIVSIAFQKYPEYVRLGITALGGIMWEPSILLINGSWGFILIFCIKILIGCSQFYLYTGQYHGHRRGAFLKLVGIENLRSNMQAMISMSCWFFSCLLRLKQMVLVLNAAKNECSC